MIDYENPKIINCPECKAFTPGNIEHENFYRGPLWMVECFNCGSTFMYDHNPNLNTDKRSACGLN